MTSVSQPSRLRTVQDTTGGIVSRTITRCEQVSEPETFAALQVMVDSPSWNG